MTARSDRDLTPESIVQKVSDASGSKYSGASSASAAPPPPMASKPVFTPTQSSVGGGGFNPLASRARSGLPKEHEIDEDGWGQDAPPITRTQLEKVPSSYQPTRVNLTGLASQGSETMPRDLDSKSSTPGDGGPVRGGYQPVGKVDIAELRRQAQKGDIDDRPTPVKGAYEPVGKVDIAAIRARAQQPSSSTIESPADPSLEDHTSSMPLRQSLPDRSAPFNTTERLTSLPKPKVANRFGADAASFTGTKAPNPGLAGLDSKHTSTAPQAGVGRTFADQGGKTPAQLWAEKKARERGLSGFGSNAPSSDAEKPAQQLTATNSGGDEWKSGYTGKSWASVQTNRPRQSSGSGGEPLSGQTDENVDHDTPSQSISDIRNKFKEGVPVGAGSTPPALDISSKPNANRGVALPSRRPEPALEKESEEPTRLPSPPPQPPRSPTPPTPPAVSGSPIQVAMPVGRGQDDHGVTSAREELTSPPLMPTRSLANTVPREEDLPDDETAHNAARSAAEATAATSFGETAVEYAQPGAEQSGKRAIVQFDYEKAEDNEIELREGEHVTDIEMVDENWWMGRNVHGESGLFPSNYVEIVEDSEGRSQPQPEPNEKQAPQGRTATALYDYEAAEDNELSFPDGAKIEDVVRKCDQRMSILVADCLQEFPDDDWWSGIYNGKAGLFPANYVQLD